MMMDRDVDYTRSLLFLKVMTSLILVVLLLDLLFD